MILLMLLPMVAWGATYDCRTQFGETVPLRRTVLKRAIACPACASPEAPIPTELIDTSLSAAWNAHVEFDSSLKSKIKRRAFTHQNRTIFLDTRYAVRKGPDFKLELSCPNPARADAKCTGHFKDPKSNNLLSFETPVFDRRLPSNSGQASIQIGQREHLGFIVRLRKNAVPVDKSTEIAVSASGELKFFREDPLFIHDVGVDEQIDLLPGYRTRIAALELKLTCSPEPKTENEKKAL